MRDNWIRWGLIPALLLLGAAGVIHLFSLRFQIGDLYPPYSSMRTDPVGGKVFYDSLAGLPGLTVHRSRQPVERLKLEGGSTLFMLGADAQAIALMDEAAAARLKDLAGEGNRVVIGFHPQNESSLLEEIEAEEKSAVAPVPPAQVPPAGDPSEPAPPTDSPLPASAPLLEPPQLPPAPPLPEPAPAHSSPSSPAPASTPDTPVSAPVSTPAAAPGSTAAPSAPAPASSPATPPEKIDKKAERRNQQRQKRIREGEQRWGVRLAFSKAAQDAEAELSRVNQAVLQAGHPGLPEKLTVHGLLSFTRLDPAWRVLYRRDNDPVVIERNFGRGSVVLAADSYWMSNEALYKDPQPALLAWLAGDSRTLVFDESHFGIVEQPGVAGLARRYRLHGLAAGLLLLGLLFIWMNASSLVPAHLTASTNAPGGAPVRGRDAASGLSNLLRRSVPKSSLLAVCLAEWKKATGRGAPRVEAAKLARLEALAAGGRRDPLAAYEEIRRLLAEKK